ncbi:Farnesoate epoxidase [Folsomia candida]|uniref:Farnesoate epoxidase n=1 Tax=Folsomia candida TaxID=158441 RepID=A0A226DZW7_FOLCA|nr:Farnesoate epoxidase [Folsomia candida]
MILLIFFTIFIVYLFMSTRRRPNELPGPFKWPIVGNLPQIAQVNWSRVWLAIDHYSKIYGGIYGMYFGPRYVVVLSDPKVVHELMKRDEWNGRPHDHMAKLKADGAILGIIMTDGELWKETRRFTFRHMRNFGYGKNTMESSVMDEVQNVVDHVGKKIGIGEHILSFDDTFGPAVLSTLWNMVASIRTELDDPAVLKLQRTVRETMQKRAFGMYDTSFGNEFKGYLTLQKVIAEHKKTRVPGEPRDFIDAYLDEQENNPENPNFFGHLNYFEAFLLEVNRYSSMAPIVTPHALTETVTYKGYEIPKGSLVFINTWGIHRNKDHWGDPDTFRPERFLDQNGKVITNDEWFLPFSSGKRRCPGEPLAKMSIFLMVSNLLQKFTFSTIPGEPRPSSVPVIGLNLAPIPYKAQSRLRKSTPRRRGAG